MSKVIIYRKLILCLMIVFLISAVGYRADNGDNQTIMIYTQVESVEINDEIFHDGSWTIFYFRVRGNLINLYNVPIQIVSEECNLFQIEVKAIIDEQERFTTSNDCENSFFSSWWINSTYTPFDLQAYINIQNDTLESLPDGIYEFSAVAGTVTNGVSIILEVNDDEIETHSITITTGSSSVNSVYSSQLTTTGSSLVSETNQSSTMSVFHSSNVGSKGPQASSTQFLPFRVSIISFMLIIFFGKDYFKRKNKNTS